MHWLVVSCHYVLSHAFFSWDPLAKWEAGQDGLGPAIFCSFQRIPQETRASSSVQLRCSVMSDSATQWTAAWQASPTPRACSNSCPSGWWWTSNHLNLCQSFLLLPSIFPSIRVFSYESVLHIRWPKYWSISFSISPSNEYSGLISLRIDWFHILAVQGTLKSFLQCHSSKASILRHSAFFIVQLLHPHMTTGKNHSLY